MEQATGNPEDENPGLRKRKRSPSKEESEDESFAGRSTTEAREDSATSGTILGSDSEIAHKRQRLQDSVNPTVPDVIPGVPVQEAPRVPRLPPDIWQHICSFLDPIFLGRLICVNRTLNELLDPKKPVPDHMSTKNLTQNDIWSASRKRLLPGFPRPLSWISELDTWKLLLGTSCQLCGRKPNNASSITRSPWASGPGQEGVRTVWPFAVRSCGKCLTTRMIKDADLRFSDVSILLSGLPYAYFTSDLNFVTSIALRTSSLPLGLDLTRYYFHPQVEQLKQEMDQAASLGQAAAAEWAKGLDAVGRRKMEDAKRFEHWEATGGLQGLLRSRSKDVIPPQHGLPAKPVLPASSISSVPAHLQGQSISAGSRTQSPLSAQYRRSPPGVSHLSGFNTPHLPLKPASPAPGQQLPGHPQPCVSVIHPQAARGRSERSVDERKAERRAEIERRCLQLVPPIKPSTLPYMKAFNNSMQIHMALNDKAWEILKPRLVDEHDDALRKEEDFLAKDKNFQPQAEQRRENEDQLKQAQTRVERQRDEAQRPVRETLAAYADELIESDWDNGALVVKDNAPQFAADLLIYVRRKFFEALDENDKLLAAQGLSTASTSPSSGGLTDRHLMLEDMKWVYETKIKPITQRYSKEIFLCGACDVDRKHYALDAVIQHYAAKHTNAFSHGSAIVYWKADWPLEPPFDRMPIRSPRSQHIDHNGVSPMYQREFGRSQYTDPVFALPGQTYPARPGVVMTPDMSHRPLDRYAPSAYSVEEDVYQPRSRLVPIQAGTPRAAMYGNGAGYGTYYVPMTPASPAMSARGLAAEPYGDHNAEVYQRPYSVHRYDPSMMSPAGINGHGSQAPLILRSSAMDYRPLTQPGQPSGFHQIQIAELARNAREIWDGTEGIDDLPDSVRTYVIIHHVVLRFHEKYTNEPSLALFADALLNHSQMKPLIKLNDLICKSCTARDNDVASSDPWDTRYQLSDLLKHFQVTHMESTVPPMAPTSALEISRPDWKFNMVQLPDERTVKSLISFPGMTDSKLSLIATVLPRYFPYSLPEVDRVPQASRSAAPMPPMGETAKQLTRPTSPTIPGEEARDYIPLDDHAIDFGRTPARISQVHQEEESVTEDIPRENEYDPHQLAARQPGSLLDYDFSRQRSSYPRPLRSRHVYDDRDAFAPPYQPQHRARDPFYNDDPYSQHQDITPRRRYIEDEHDIQTRYLPATSQYLHRPRPHEEIRFDDDREHGRARDPIQQVKLEGAHSPMREPASGATQFLDNFDTEGVSADRRNSPDGTSLPDRASNNASSNRTGQTFAGPRHIRDRLDAQARPGTSLTSRKGTPRKVGVRRGASARSRSPSSLPRDDAHLPEEQAYLRHPANTAFDHEPSQQAQYADPRYFERPIYEDDLVPQHYVPVNTYRTRTPGHDQQNMPLHYVEARSLAPYRYSDDRLYEQPGQEYAHVMPRGRPQYIERRVLRNDMPGYVGADSGYNRAADGRGDQTYYEAPPRRPEIRYSPYDDRRRY